MTTKTRVVELMIRGHNFVVTRLGGLRGGSYGGPKNFDDFSFFLLKNCFRYLDMSYEDLKAYQRSNLV